MQVVNKSQYITTIYSAIVVNKDTSQDPDNKGRVQIYIPSANYEFADVYMDYINTEDKPLNQHFNDFPWAVTLVDDIKNGDEVYGSYIGGDNNQYIIIGIDGGISNSADSAGELNLDTSDIVNLAMPIIMHNEIGVALSAWNDNTIPDNKFGSITLHDGGQRDSSGRWIKQGCWAIGLIQWNGVRAYDTCYEIAKADSNWKSYFTHDCDLKRALSSSISSQSTSNQRSNFSIEKGWNPEKGGATYNAIVNLISSSTGKNTQKILAYNDTAKIIDVITNAGCTNKAIIIYLADFYNQYGSGHSATTQKAVEACKQSGDMIAQLDWFITNQLKPNFSSFNTYKNRRNTTYNYVKELYNSGKLNEKDLTNIDEGSSPVIAGTGQYCMPVTGHILISAGYGVGKNKGGQGYSNSPHNGMDFAIASGTPIFACTSGRAVYDKSGSWGNHVFIYADDGNLLVLAHMSGFAGTDRKVKKGEKIGYVGSTGNSTGPHVHLGITDAKNGTSGLYNANVGKGKNPAPFLGIKNQRDVYIDV